MEIPFNEVYGTMLKFLDIKPNLSKLTIVRRCSSYFGATPDLVHALWKELVGSNNIPEKGELKHLLWALSFLKNYSTYSKYSTDYGVRENTFSKWIWLFIPAIARMKHLVSTFTVLHFNFLILNMYCKCTISTLTHSSVLGSTCTDYLEE